MILYENMKAIEHILVHPIRVLSHLKIYFYIIAHIEVADEFITSKNTDLTGFFIIKPRHLGRLKKQIWVDSGSPGSPGHPPDPNVWEPSVGALVIRRIQMCLQRRGAHLEHIFSASEAKSFCSTDLKLWRCLLHRLDLK